MLLTESEVISPSPRSARAAQWNKQRSIRLGNATTNTILCYSVYHY